MRTDFHRVSKIKPSDYKYLFSFSLPGINDAAVNMALLSATRSGRTIMESVYSLNKNGLMYVSGSHSVHPYGGEGIKFKFFSGSDAKCDICGANFIHGDVWQHKSGECIILGHICASKYSLFANRDSWDKEYKKIKKMSFDSRIRAEKNTIRISALRLYLSKNREMYSLLCLDHPIVKDMRGRLINFPQRGLSEKQISFLKRLNEDAKKRESIPLENRKKAPNGRLLVSGMVLGLKEQASEYGTVTKMIVELTGDYKGSKVWCTAPKQINKNDNIDFKATFQISDRDPYFAFGKRPVLV